jgi:SAM-dependent methyltransferase
MTIREHNRKAWDKSVARGSPYTIPVSREIIADARQGNWSIFLTPTKPVPREWLPDIRGKRILCLASGGGQQAPVLAAVGARVTVFDNSPGQLEQDRLVAKRDGLEIATVEGDMADLSKFTNGSFDIIVHPVSNVFVPDVLPVWKEALRVLDKNGVLLSGFDNPALYIFDWSQTEQRGILEVKHRLPYSDIKDLPQAEKQRYEKEGIPFEFSHTLDDLIGGQIKAGFVITGFYEDYDVTGQKNPLNNFMPTYMVTRAVKMTKV